MLIMILGLPGSGKTTFAEALAASLDAVHLNAKIIRSKLGKRGTDDSLSKSVIYAKLLKQTESYLYKGEVVIVDATFYKMGLRKPYRLLAKKYRKPLFVFYVQAEEASIKQRLQEKLENGTENYEDYLTIKKVYEPLKEPHLLMYSDIFTLEEMIAKARAYMNLSPSKISLG